MSHFYPLFLSIDTAQPWLQPFLGIHRAFADTGKDSILADWLNSYFAKQSITPCHHDDGKPLHFVSQDDLPHGTPYERFIYTQHKIPTRDNLHDWFGACIWSAFPKSKALLNAKHIAHMTDDDGKVRNRLRDTITVFDENGAILVVSDEAIGADIADGLVKFDWQRCLIDRRQHWEGDTHPNAKAKVFIFGHALLEQLINPYKSLCSHALVVSVPPPFFDETLKTQLAFLDECLALRLNRFLQDGVTPRQLNPLPILGVPHFWDNGDPAFYDDVSVFRTGRRHSHADKE